MQFSTAFNFCNKHSTAITPLNIDSQPQATTTQPATVNPGTVDEEGVDRLHKISLHTLQCCGCTGTTVTAGAAAWQFAALNYLAGGLFAYVAGVGALGTFAFYKYATVRSMDGIVVALGGTSLKFQEENETMKESLKKFQEEKDLLIQQINDLTNSVDSYKNSTKVLIGESKQLNDKIEKEKYINTILKNQNEQFVIVRDSMQKIIDEFAKASLQSHEEISILHEKVNELTQSEADLNLLLQNENADITIIKNHQEEISDKNAKVQASLGSIQAFFKERAEQIKQMQLVIAELNKLDDPYIDTIKKLTVVLKKLDSDILTRTEELKKLQAQYAELEGKTKQLQPPVLRTMYAGKQQYFMQ